MPAKSKSQQRLMGMVHRCQKTGKCASSKIEDIAKTIKTSDATAFAETKHNSLPNKVATESMTFREFLITENMRGKIDNWSNNTNTSTPEISYEDFMRNVDKVLSNKIGFGHQDVEDWNWYSAYEDQYTPEDAVDAFMEETGMDMY